MRAQGRGLSPHFASVHPDYVKWYRQYWKVFIFGSMALIPFLVLGDYFAIVSHDFALLVIINVLYVAFVSSNVMRYPSRLRYFRRQSTKKRQASFREL